MRIEISFVARAFTRWFVVSVTISTRTAFNVHSSSLYALFIFDFWFFVRSESEICLFLLLLWAVFWQQILTWITTILSVAFPPGVHQANSEVIQRQRQHFLILSIIFELEISVWYKLSTFLINQYCAIWHWLLYFLCPNWA